MRMNVHLHLGCGTSNGAIGAGASVNSEAEALAWVKETLQWGEITLPFKLESFNTLKEDLKPFKIYFSCSAKDALSNEPVDQTQELTQQVSALNKRNKEEHAYKIARNIAIVLSILAALLLGRLAMFLFL
jgi:hypothetical protein